MEPNELKKPLEIHIKGASDRAEDVAELKQVLSARYTISAGLIDTYWLLTPKESGSLPSAGVASGSKSFSVNIGGGLSVEDGKMIVIGANGERVEVADMPSVERQVEAALKVVNPVTSVGIRTDNGKLVIKHLDGVTLEIELPTGAGS